MTDATCESYFCVLVPFTKSDAHKTISNTALSPRTQRLAEYWLSLWQGTELPARTAIVPSAIKNLLSDVVFYLVAPRMAVSVRMAGTRFGAYLGFDPSGHDWLELTPAHYRAERLTVFTGVAAGAIARGEWHFRHLNDRFVCEKLLLPLRTEPNVPGIPVLGFVDWTALRNLPAAASNLVVLEPPRLIGGHRREGFA